MRRCRLPLISKLIEDVSLNLNCASFMNTQNIQIRYFIILTSMINETNFFSRRNIIALDLRTRRILLNVAMADVVLYPTPIWPQEQYLSSFSSFSMLDSSSQSSCSVKHKSNLQPCYNSHTARGAEITDTKLLTIQDMFSKFSDDDWK